jgi:DNA-damage-inducible protein J
MWLHIWECSLRENDMADCVIRSRIDPLVKAKAIDLFEHMGLTLSEAIRIFIYQSVSENRIPFSINAPNAVTRAAMREVRAGKNLEKTSLKKLRKNWQKYAKDNPR